MLKRIIKKLIRNIGFDIVRYHKEANNGSQSAIHFPPDFDREAIDIINAVKAYTMTSPERLFALINAVRYITQAGIPGDLVECGVWRGGSMMAVAHMLKRLGCNDRCLYLFDTYEGMTRPDSLDVDYAGKPALTEFEAAKKTKDSSSWCYASLEEVYENIASTGYDMSKVKFVKGKVETTIPASAPSQISLLRLDTDWYQSTKHELVHLFPRLSEGGVLIIDDYGYWQGSQKATDEYFMENRISILLNRIDFCARIAVKL
ncbi:MAG: TylF/MycF/NovP-related O-methyltransferase [Acidobacteriota bacterium]